MAHPFFEGVNWDRIRRQEEPVPAYGVVFDKDDPSKVLDFNFSPPVAEFAGQDVRRSTVKLDRVANKQIVCDIPHELVESAAQNATFT